ncbi:Rne/Rng family ribonuclease [Demequina sp.]|uniref:Rne/Rng family ribonuclease n=1 Tax=Demequina sp. TaxID=2050685 RepID=UPI0025C0F555|nr:Rne/Rng family ribonuclease [Demequina sp.]
MSEDNTTAPNAVIFQAPQPAPETPVKRAPRRASAPAGPPSAATKPSHGAKSTPAAKKTKAASGADSTPDTSGNDTSETGETKPKRTRAKKAPAASSDKDQSKGDQSKDDQPKDGESRSDQSRDTDKPQDKGADAADSGNQGPDSSSTNGDDGDDGAVAKRRRRRGGRGRGKRRPEGEGDDNDGDSSNDASSNSDKSGSGDSGSREDSSWDDGDGSGTSRRRRRSRSGRASRSSSSGSGGSSGGGNNDDQLQGSTRLQAKRQRRRDSRDGQRRRPVISEAEFLARRESVKRDMVVREKDGRVQIAVLEDDVLVEHYVSHQAEASMAGNVYLGRVQNVLPGMEAAFVDVGRGRNAVLYAGEVNWDAAGLDGKPKRIELALKPGDTVMVQVTKDPIGHKGARVTSQISLAGRFLVYVPGGGVTGISRKLPDTERNRLKKLLREVIPADAGVIVRTAAEGASEDELRADVERLKRQWESIEAEAKGGKAPQLLRGEPDMAIRVVRDIFNEDFESLTIQGEDTWNSLSAYVGQVATDLAPRLHRFVGKGDVFAERRIDEQLAKGMDRKVYLPSGGSLVIDRTEAMTVVDVNTGKFVGKGGTLEETMTLNNLEAAEEIVRQLRLRDIGGIIVIDFVDMLLEANRDRVLRRLIECLSRDRTKHQVAEVTSLGLVQMTRKRVGQGLVEAFSETCEHCKGRGFLVHGEPVGEAGDKQADSARKRNTRSTSTKAKAEDSKPAAEVPALDQHDDAREAVKATLASIAAAAEKAHHAHDDGGAHHGAASETGVEQPSDAEPADADVAQ